MIMLQQQDTKDSCNMVVFLVLSHSVCHVTFLTSCGAGTCDDYCQPSSGQWHCRIGHKRDSTGHHSGEACRSLSHFHNHLRRLPWQPDSISDESQHLDGRAQK